PTLSWNPSSDALSYRLQVSTSSSFGSTVYDSSGLTTSSQAPGTLAYSTTYYWRVNATADNTSAWSQIWSFTTGAAPPAAPTLSSPANGTCCTALTVMLTWNAASGATAYNMYIYNDANTWSWSTSTTSLSTSVSL